MNKHEREARLKQVREKKAALESQLRKFLDQQKREREQEKRQRDEKEAAERKQGKFIKYLKMLNPFWLMNNDMDLLSSVIKISTVGPLLLGAQKAIEELELEEAQLLDASVEEAEKTEVKEDPDVRARNDIFAKITTRKQERVQRILQVTGGKSPEDWTSDDKERVAKINNIFDEADERDMEGLSKLL
jgi:hypothetical protein